MKKYGPFVLRIGIGGLFLAASLMHLMNPAKVVNLLTILGFPVPLFLTWLLVFAEVICGAAVVVGFKIKYATIPLAVILLVAISTKSPSQLSTALKEAALLVCTVALWMLGPGIWGIDKK